MSVIKYDEHFKIRLKIEESSEAEELDMIEVEVITWDDDDEEVIAADILIKKITGDADQFVEIADIDSGDFLEGVASIFHDENNELMTATLKIDYLQFMNQLLYVDQVIVHTDNLSMIGAALASTIKQITKASAPNDWCSMIYKNRTFRNEKGYLDDKDVSNILKSLQYRKIPKAATGLSENTLFLTGGELFDCKIKYDNKVPSLKLK